MKKLALLMASLVLALSLAACGNTEELTGELKWDMPEGFEETKNEEGTIYYTHVENASAANINYTTTSNDGSLEGVTASVFVDEIANQYSAAGYGDITINVESESNEKIDGRTAFTYEMSYEIMGVGVHQIHTVVEDGNEYKSFTFSWFDYEEGYEDVMRAAAASIRFE